MIKSLYLLHALPPMGYYPILRKDMDKGPIFEPKKHTKQNYSSQKRNSKKRRK